jgi:hypothetical protein
MSMFLYFGNLASAMCIAVAACLSCSACGQDRPASISPSIETILKWLPADSNNVFVATNGGKNDDSPKRSKFLDSAIGIPSSLVDCLPNCELRNSLTPEKLTSAVQGIRTFSQSLTAGDRPFLGAQILLYDEKLASVIKQQFCVFSKSASSTTQIRGQQVSVIGLNEEMADCQKLYICTPDAGIVIVATDKEYLNELLKRRIECASESAVFHLFPEAAFVDASSPIWAIRKFVVTGNVSNVDSTSPLHLPASSNRLVPHDPDAVGIVFWFDETKKLATILYISPSPSSLQLATEQWNWLEEYVQGAKLKLRSPGVVEIAITLDEGVDDEAILAFHMMLCGYLGFVFPI